ncbi:hypothetical protein ZMO1_ZMOp32x012 (plasmid) [Zymomonas mobilis subsp. mobilis ZM4 = ATCC 31821]|uniref:Uncharacterized protein n=1 Tax=Zymomonas mobilis subsp. mobilis (strain ATCC 31821 / ZM4 / CP4) TaxID=264203 RepID=A0A806D7X2_ZYMMO|nr:hypothetical protein [Zymomonas mobilis]ADC33934.1 hypothetical protein ZZM4_0169 [Zymomonas mobilis subsp. mobilis ZM4 = ATCC 31821]AVZ26802.1 hypothetical protein ZMO2_ZMOp32x012 [Zymomonas mobilis subsp. mobilis]AVZ28688.1 hypothetical protein ZMO3_ZMOp32x012 [Zymomonas mobilis subsp. mobilis]AVZ43134.1 hypothetical protein ZMO1_ZMOp32x012 [Zymomonas mobilis subsp. mobilis ZM4 = ATCC 31821]
MANKEPQAENLFSQLFDSIENNGAICSQITDHQSLKVFLKSSTNKTAIARLSLGLPVSLLVKSKINDN